MVKGDGASGSGLDFPVFELFDTDDISYQLTRVLRTVVAGRAVGWRREWVWIRRQKTVEGPRSGRVEVIRHLPSFAPPATQTDYT